MTTDGHVVPPLGAQHSAPGAQRTLHEQARGVGVGVGAPPSWDGSSFLYSSSGPASHWGYAEIRSERLPEALLPRAFLKAEDQALEARATPTCSMLKLCSVPTGQCPLLS